MFYFYEIKFRLKYLFLSSFFVASGLYYNCDLLLFLLTHRVAEVNSNEITLFTYSNSAELNSLHITVAFYFSSFFLFFSLLYHCLCFSKSSLMYREYSSLSVFSISLLMSVIYFNLYISVLLFPDLWLHSIETSPDFFSFESTLGEYLLTFQFFILRINFCSIITFLLCFFVLFSELQVSFYFFRYYLALNTLMMCSLLSPGYEEFYIYLFPVFFLEFTLFFSIFNHKIRKFLKLLSGHYVK